MKSVMVASASLLRDTANLIEGPRAAEHGPAEKTFADIAARWSQRFGVPVSAPQVAACMIDLKLVRIDNGEANPDDWRDVCGYAALGGALSSQSDDLDIAEAIERQHANGTPPVNMAVVRKAAAAPIVPVGSVSQAESMKTAQDDAVAPVGASEDQSPTTGLWRPQEGKFGKTRDGRKVGPMLRRTADDDNDEAYHGCFIWIGRIEGGYDEYFTENGGWLPHEERSSLDLISEWTGPDEGQAVPEEPLQVREGKSYVDRIGGIWHNAKPKGDDEDHPWLLFDDHGDWYDFRSDGKFFSDGPDSDHDLIREVPAPQAEPLDPVAIYGSDPTSIFDSVWLHEDSGEEVKFYSIEDGECVVQWPSGDRTGWSWDDLLEKFTLIRLAPAQEAAE